MTAGTGKVSPEEVAAVVAKELAANCKPGSHATLIFKAVVKDGVIQRESVTAQRETKPLLG